MRNQAKTEFDALCLKAAALLDEAAKIAMIKGLSDIDRLKAQAAAGLAGVTFHKISIHGADPTDFQAVEDDLMHIARKVEPLISEIGAEARANSSVRIDEALFADTIQTGLENAFSELRWAAGQVAMEAAE